jgi:hypothetical protein
MLKKFLILITISFLLSTTACGTITGWDKKEPFKGAVYVGNAGLLLLGLIPGVVGFAVDFVNKKL